MTDTLKTLQNDENHFENVVKKGEQDNSAVVPQKKAASRPKKTFCVSIPNEAEYRRKCTTLSVLDWNRQSTPKRRDQFKHAKVSLRSSDNKWSVVPRLAVIAGITHSTWNKSIQALFSTQNCDAMYSLGIAVVYFQRILTALGPRPEGVLRIEGDSIPLDGPIARNMQFVASNILAMKYCDDLHLSNNYQSKVFKVPLLHLNEWERLALLKLDWRLGYTEAERTQIMLELSAHIET